MELKGSKLLAARPSGSLPIACMRPTHLTLMQCAPISNTSLHVPRCFTGLLLVAAGMRLFMWVTLWTCCVVLPVNYSVSPQDG
jgi:hypothetical protein